MSIKDEALAELALARDEARLHVHLLTMEARQRWQRLEVDLDSLQQKLLNTDGHASEAVLTSARQLARVVRDLFAEYAAAKSALTRPAIGLMSRSLYSCLPSDSLNQAARLLWEGDCGALPVITSDGRLVGMITDRDICMASYTQGRLLSDVRVEQAMSKAVKACLSDEPLFRVLEIMEQSQVRRVPVLQHGAVVGMIALADIARWIDALPAARGAACDALVKTLSRISRAASSPATAPAQAAE